MPVFNEDATRRIRAAVRRSEDALPVDGEQPEPPWVWRGQDDYVLPQALASGAYYRGVLALHQGPPDTFAPASGTVFIRALDNSALPLGQVLWARGQGTHTIGSETNALYHVDPAPGAGAPPAGEVCHIDGGAGWVDACDPVTGAGGAFTQPVQVTLPAGSTVPSLTVNQPGTATPAWSVTSTATTFTAVSNLPGGATPWMTATATGAGGLLQFGLTTSTGTRPAGLFQLPIQNAAGKPTWTPDAGTYPELYDPVDKRDYQWDGSGWGYFALDPLTTKGDLWGYGTTDARLPVGADYTLLGAKSTAALGLAYMTCAQSVVCDATGIHLVGDSGAPAAGSYYGTDGGGAKGFYALPSAPGTATPAWIKVSLAYGAFSAAANTITITAYTYPVRGIVNKALLFTKTAFAAAGLTALHFTATVAGNDILSLHNGLAAGAVTQANEASAGGYLGYVWSMSATTALTVTATSAGALLNALTAGELELYLETAQLPAP